MPLRSVVMVLTGDEAGGIELLEDVLPDDDEVAILVLLLSASSLLALVEELLRNFGMECGEDVPEELPGREVAFLQSRHVLGDILELEQDLGVDPGQGQLLISRDVHGLDLVDLEGLWVRVIPASCQP